MSFSVSATSGSCAISGQISVSCRISAVFRRLASRLLLQAQNRLMNLLLMCVVILNFVDDHVETRDKEAPC